MSTADIWENASIKISIMMPLLFLGHGSPMNAIEENEFVTGFRNISQYIPRPKAILSISAHWETKGTMVTAMENPATIHDFGGFPKTLFEVQYPAPGHPELANEIKRLVTKADVGLDFDWGLDHGTWSVVKHLYPNADVPVIQMSLDYDKSPMFHYELAKELVSLRQNGVLIIGSGNIVHNLGLVDWDNPGGGYEWAETAREKIKKFIAENNYEALTDYRNHGMELRSAIPTPEHFLPALCILALKAENEKVHFFNDKTVLGSMAMTSFIIGAQPA